ncbi:hypothetical protein IWX92DRAFT_376253 [Phyllosticta citricarpa]
MSVAPARHFLAAAFGVLSARFPCRYLVAKVHVWLQCKSGAGSRELVVAKEWDFVLARTAGASSSQGYALFVSSGEGNEHD